MIPVAIGGGAQAQEPPYADWDCPQCDASFGLDLDLKGGPAYVGDDAYRFGNQSGLDKSDWYLFGDVTSRYIAADLSFLNVEGFLRGGDSNALFAEGGKQGIYEVRASYQSIPQRFFDSGVTPYGGVGSGSLTLPGTWIRGTNTALMTDLENSARPVEIGLDWTNFGIGFDVDAVRDWTFSVDYRRRQKEGVRRSAGSFLFNAVEFTSPLDYATDDLEVVVGYSRDTWEANLTYYSSVFDNDSDALRWDNPYQGINGDNAGRTALAPDNEFHQVTLSGATALPARTMLSGQVSAGSLEQDDILLPYTINPTITTAPLPISRLDGKVSTLNYNVRVVSSPIEKLSLEGEIRYNEFDNEAPLDSFQYVITDVELAPAAVRNTAFGYERRDIKLSGNYRLRRRMKLYAGYDTRRFERNRQERRTTDTDRLWFRFSSRWSNVAEMNLDLFSEERDGSSYEFLGNPAAPQNPLMRKYNLADRDREGVRLRGAFLGSDRADVGVEFEMTDDSYDRSTIGLLASEYSRIGASFSWLVNASASVYATIDNETIETDQANSQSFSLPDWTATTDDEITTGTFGAAFPQLFGGRLGGRLSYTWSQAEGSTRNNTNGLPNEFPDLNSERQTVSLGLDYPYSDNLAFGLEVFYEQLESDDWALDGVDPDTALNLLAFGADAWNYDLSVIYLSVRYQLDAL